MHGVKGSTRMQVMWQMDPDLLLFTYTVQIWYIIKYVISSDIIEKCYAQLHLKILNSIITKGIVTLLNIHFLLFSSYTC